MKTRVTGSLLVAVAALTIFSTQLTHAATIVDIDATSMGVADGTVVLSIANSGTAGVFTTVTGSVEAASHPSNSGLGLPIQGLGFGGDKMTSAVDTTALGMIGNHNHTVMAWVWNPAISNEEAIVAWGRRGGPEGTNMGFHQGVHGGFGATGHWGGGPDMGWGPGGTGDAIDDTIGRWAHLAYTYDGTTQKVFIDGVETNSEAFTTLNTHATFADNTTLLKFSLGSENTNNGDPNAFNNADINFSGTIARVVVLDEALSDADVLAAYDASSQIFVEGIPEPGSFVLAVMGLMSLVALRRRRRR